ncbi:MAG: AIR synthase related protein [Candidatus Moduliflexus flocculans]|nr:AIR synthase related protein [Candidatus Moduliflexus flocculans]
MGRLAVNGTVNDLVVSGAEPRFLSLALIIEEGLETAVLDRVIGSIRSGGPRGARPDRHRRHQGRPPRAGGQGLHQHGRRGPVDRPAADRRRSAAGTRSS